MRVRAAFATVDTAADDPAFLLFTSGTTGPAKGALHAHRSLLGHYAVHRDAARLLPAAGRCGVVARPTGPGSPG